MKTSRRNILRDGGPPSPPCSAEKAAGSPVCCKNWALGRWTAGALLLMLILFLLWREGDQLDWALLLGLALLFLRDSDP